MLSMEQPAGTCDSTRNCSMASESESTELLSVKEQLQTYEAEIDALVRLFNEGDDGVSPVGRRTSDGGGKGKVAQRRKAVAFLEGSRLPYSALCKAIFEDLSQRIDQTESESGSVTLAGIQTLVLASGQRVSFGVTGGDTIILEDDNPRCLWRWEARDTRLLPKVSRDQILERRRWSKKIGERVKALSATVQSLSNAETAGSEAGRLAFLNAKDSLARTDSEAVLRAGREPRHRESGSPGVSTGGKSNVPRDPPLGDVSSEVGQDLTPKNKRRAPEGLEKLRQEKVEKRQKVQSEKELKREQKQLQRQKQDEAERKRQQAMSKQANFMSRIFGKKSAVGSGEQGQQSVPSGASAASEMETADSSHPEASPGSDVASVAAQIDVELRRCNELDVEALRKCHVDHWTSLRIRDCSSRTRKWNVRRKPKVSPFTELRLQGTAGYLKGCSQDGHQEDSESRRLSNGESPLKLGRGDYGSCDVESKDTADFSVSSSQDEVKKSISGKFHFLRNKVKKLLQFDKSHRPAYYGTHSKQSKCIKPRRPFGQDPDLNYAVDSDEEWEEENPGESLSDVDMEDDEEERELEATEEDEDGEFFVPDGYLSEGEGVIDDFEHDKSQDALSGSHLSPATPAQENVLSLEQLRRILDNATENAIRANHPLIISNFGPLPDKGDNFESPQVLTKRSDTLCLEALRMRVLVPGVVVSVV